MFFVPVNEGENIIAAERVTVLPEIETEAPDAGTVH